MRRRLALVWGAALPILWAGCGGETTRPRQNQPPRIISVTASPAFLTLGAASRVSGFAADPNGDSLLVSWTGTAGTFEDPTRPTTTWTAPGTPGLFRLDFTVTDRVETVTDSVFVTSGNAGLAVVSDPPDAFITLDNAPSSFKTPHTFFPIAPGPHGVELLNLFFRYEDSTRGIELVHGQTDTLRFRIAPPLAFTLDLGRPFDELGGVAFLPSGSGMIYAGRTAAGTGLFTSGLNLPSGTPNGFLLTEGVRMDEPITLSADGTFVFFVTDTDSLALASIEDLDNDGVVDGLHNRTLLRDRAFSPAMSPTDLLAFSSDPAHQPVTNPVFASQFADTALEAPVLATGSFGKLPSWNRSTPFLAFVREGVILTAFLDPVPRSGDTLVAGGYNTAPAWGPWGPEHVAYLHGDDAGSLTEVRLAVQGTVTHVTVADGLMDPRYIAWSPTLRSFVVTHNPAGGQMRLISRLPIP